MANGPEEEMVKVRDLLLRCCVGLESVTCTVNKRFPGVVGVPEITPEAGCKVKPEGSEPVTTFHV